MKKKFGVLFGFFCLGMLDAIAAYIFPIDFTYTHLSIVWHFYLTGLLVYVRDKPWLTRWLIGLLAGFVFDAFFSSSFPICFALYGFLAWLSGFWRTPMPSKRRHGFIYMSLLFLADFIPYTIQRFLGMSNVSLWIWLYRIELLTWLFGALICIALIHMDLIMDRFYAFQARVNQPKPKSKATKIAAH